jgi:superfamily II DNA or RNA helicase
VNVTIKQKDAVNLFVECEKSTAKELNQYFTFYVPNYQYTPAYKKKIWDGQIRLFNLYKRTIYSGLLDYITKFCKDRNYNIDYELISNENNIPKDDFFTYTRNLNLKFKPYAHQLSAAHNALTKKRSLLLSPTGSGKSLIIYLITRYLLDVVSDVEKILIIVPTVGLVNQMYSDFETYSEKSIWSTELNMHKIFAGQEKETKKKIVVSTWQSLYNMPDDFFLKFDAVFGDECHLFKSKSLVSMMTKLTNSYYRIGTTGTLDGTLTHKLVLEGLFGPVFKVTSTKKLIENKLLNDVEIRCLNLTYSEQDRNFANRLSYQDEIKFLIENKIRNDFIKDLCISLKGNTLLLFNYVELHGKVLYDIIEKNKKDKKIFFIYGGTDAEQREEIRTLLNKESNCILIASYGTCSTGINIPKINNVVFASPSKSVIRVLQSIGRGLRKAKNKEKTIIYDISDNLTYNKYVNHTMRHLEERMKIYSNEKFSYEATKIKLT